MLVINKTVKMSIFKNINKIFYYVVLFISIFKLPKNLNIIEFNKQLNLLIKMVTFISILYKPLLNIKTTKNQLKVSFEVKPIVLITKLKTNEYFTKILNTVFLVKPTSIEFNAYQLVKMFIRHTNCFSKTKYSFIRQECKNIVLFVLLLNIISINAILLIYFKLTLVNMFIISLQIFFIIINIQYLYSMIKNLRLFFKLITYSILE